MRDCNQGENAEPDVSAWTLGEIATPGADSSGASPKLCGRSILLDHGPRKWPLHARRRADSQLDGNHVPNGNGARGDRSGDDSTVGSGIGDCND
jgi:hypothetical protein